jgi:hypothetical protein
MTSDDDDDKQFEGVEQVFFWQVGREDTSRTPPTRSSQSSPVVIVVTLDAHAGLDAGFPSPFLGDSHSEVASRAIRGSSVEIAPSRGDASVTQSGLN